MSQFFFQVRSGGGGGRGGDSVTFPGEVEKRSVSGGATSTDGPTGAALPSSRRPVRSPSPSLSSHNPNQSCLFSFLPFFFHAAPHRWAPHAALDRRSFSTRPAGGRRRRQRGEPAGDTSFRLSVLLNSGRRSGWWLRLARCILIALTARNLPRARIQSSIDC